MKIKTIAFGLLTTALLSSCSSQRNTLPYFQDLNPEVLSVAVDPGQYEPKIEPSDELIITVTSKFPDLTLRYNLPLQNPALAKDGFIAVGNVQQSTYIVSPEGDIVMPIIGKVHVAGMTTDQLAEFVSKEVEKEVEDPTVIVRLVNFAVDVAGEVANPGRYSAKGQRLSILDALSEAGDLTPYGERTNVLVIREENGKRQAHAIDLTSADALSSPYFYLKQNDYIYVAPNKIRTDNARYNQNNAFKLSVISTIVSGVSVIASLVIALAIK